MQIQYRRVLLIKIGNQLSDRTFSMTLHFKLSKRLAKKTLIWAIYLLSGRLHTYNYLLNQMNKLIVACVIALFVVGGSAFKGVDVSDLFNLDTFQCFVRNGAQFAVVQAFSNTGYVDNNALQNLKALKNLGLKTDIFMRHCRGRDPITQVNTMMDSLPTTYYDTVWVYVEKNVSPGCDWSSFVASTNCAYLNSLAKAIENRGKNVGFYSSVSDWTYAFQNVNACPQLASYPLWYEYADDTQSFNNFRSFGGWSQPSMKRYSTNFNWCGTESTNLNFRY